ncbi:MAG TPA: nickel-dependent hydrogenase large subunit, partial [Vicinamibacterales bacterium]|nr:nickel-dependent hydrogenase large subunit [Vicinamibacterales bacterium]
MSTHITVDPVTRIEGHLRIDVEIDGGVVKQAWSSGQMFRGIERILIGRDPRDAWLFTQRFCGVCTTVHAIASVRAVENALKLQIPPNAQYIRNLILAAHAMHDHIVHFYQLSALDWVDVVSALKADVPKAAALAASLSEWPGNSTQQFQAVKDRLARFVAKGQMGIFTNGYWGHPAMKLSPEVNLMAVTHYLQALDYQRSVNQVVAILGGKTPNIQNLAVGGVANAINLDSDSALNMARLYQVKDLLDSARRFIGQVYFVDVCAVGAMYADWLTYGSGVTSYLSVPDLPTDAGATRFDLPGGTIFNGDLKNVKAITSFEDPYFQQNVSECIAHAWYDGDWMRHPYEEETVPRYTGYKADGKYSW